MHFQRRLQVGLFSRLGWTYWEKFDYWAPFWGGTIIGVSGMLMWFLHIAAKFLLDKFPLDRAMLTGTFTRDELMHEHPRQYKRLMESGELEMFMRFLVKNRLIRCAYINLINLYLETSHATFFPDSQSIFGDLAHRRRSASGACRRR